jgi:predicted ATPase/DNA-binding SARP family transcriptional activator
VEFRILGPLEVWAGGRPLALGSAKQRSLLAALLLNAGKLVTSERLIEQLWGDAPPKAAGNALWVSIARLRNALEPGRAKGTPSTLLLTRPSGYVLRVGPGELDVERFEGLRELGVQALAAQAPQKAARLLRQALDLWRGPALADLALEPLAYGHIVRLEELRLVTLEERIEADLAEGRHQELVGELEALAAAHPFRERLRAHLMLALYRSGRQAEALEVYHATRATLSEELGIDPTPLLQDLYKAIVSQDPALRWMAEAADGTVSELEVLGHASQQVAPKALAVWQAGSQPRGAVRKTVTVVCMSVTAGAEGEGLDPESLGAMQDRCFGDLCRMVERHGGTIQQLTGDTVTAVFGVPVLHENDAVRSVRAAMDGQVALQEASEDVEQAWGVRLSFSAGIYTGQVMVGPEGRIPIALAGMAPRLARRLEEAAAPGDILMGANTYGLVRDAVRVEPGPPLPVTDNGSTIPAWRLVRVRPGVPGRTRRLGAPMIGRVDERRLLNHAFERTAAGRTCHLFTVLGAAGVGKSRLVQEFLTDVGQRATVLRGRCLDYGEGITFWALAEVVREAIGATEAASPSDVRALLAALLAQEEHAELLTDRLAAMMGLAEAAVPAEEIRWAARRLLATLARSRPVVVVLDDLHWAEPMLLDLIEHVADWTRDAPLLLCCVARPELLDARPDWGGGKFNASSILLEPLDTAHCATLIDNLLGRADLSPSVKLQLGETAEGNPLFVEELVAMLIDEGVFTQTGDHRVSTGDLAALPIPLTITALLDARLDQLGVEERAVAERASLVGKVFSRRAVTDLLPAAMQPAVDTHLRSLTRKDLIQPDRSSSTGWDAFSFRHQLIRQAAYEAMPKQLRARLHQQLAMWLEQLGEQTTEHQEIVGYHLEQAYRYRHELGLVDEQDHVLARTAADRLAAAGRKAFAQGDMPAAANLLSRAAGLLPPEDPWRLDLLPDLGLALIDTGALEDADAVLTQAVELARAAGRARLAWRAALPGLGLRLNLRPEHTTTDDVRKETELAIAELAELGDDLGLARAWRLLCEVYNTWNQGAALAAAAERALAHATRAGDQREQSASLAFLAMALESGPTPIGEAVQRCTDLLDQATDNRGAEVRLVENLALLRASNQQFAQARELITRARAIAEDLGLKWAMAKLAWSSGDVERMAGNLAAAERELRAGYSIYLHMGEKSHLSSLAAYLAEVLHGQGRDAEALGFTELSEAAAAQDDLLSQVRWRGTRAKILAGQRRTEQAERLAREGVRLAEQTDWLDMRADALADLADVLQQADRPQHSLPLLQHALLLYEQKGNRVGVQRTRAQLARLLS